MKYTLLIALALSCNAHISFEQDITGYARTNEYGSMRMTLDGFKNIITTIKYYTEESEKQADSVRVEMACGIGRGTESIGITSYENILSLNIGKEEYTRAWYSYTCVCDSGTLPIMGVYLYLNETERELKIVGTDERKVDALYRDLNEQISSYENTIRPWMITLSTAFALLVIIIVLFRFSIKAKERNTRIATSVLCILSMVASLIVLGFSFGWVPNFILTTDTSTFTDRFFYVIGIISSILGILSTLYVTVAWIRKKMQSPGIAKEAPVESDRDANP